MKQADKLHVDYNGQILVLSACNGGLWPRGIGEAAVMCNPEFDYNDSYGTRLNGTSTWLIAWHDEICYPHYAEGALVTIEGCPAWDIRVPSPDEPADLESSPLPPGNYGLTRMVCCHRIKEARRVELRKVCL